MRSVPFAFESRFEPAAVCAKRNQIQPPRSPPPAADCSVRIQSLRQKGPAPFRFRGYRKRRESCISAGSFFLSKSDPLRRAPILFLDWLGIRYEHSDQKSTDFITKSVLLRTFWTTFIRLFNGRATNEVTLQATSLLFSAFIPLTEDTSLCRPSWVLRKQGQTCSRESGPHPC